MKSSTKLQRIIPSLPTRLHRYAKHCGQVLLALGWLPLCSHAQAVSPPPDGGYPGGNTAEGQSALLSLTTGRYNTAVGLFSLKSTMDGSWNTAIGAGALFSNVSSANSAFGTFALYGNTSGSSNTAVGVYALRFNSAGNSNTAIGRGALFANDIGHSNTATGYQALNSNTSGHSNTATGYGALSRNTFAVLNTANGYAALLGNTSGSNNTANGAGALYSNTEGENNTASGLEALFANTTGAANTATGNAALELNTAGTGNTAYGYAALASNSTGVYNIAVGTFAGSNLTTGNNNIDIGADGVAGESDTIRIGNTDSSDTFIRGISGTTVASGAMVFVAANGHLGTMTSSARFKEEIKPMDKASQAILALKPVTFRYKKELDPAGLRQFGLVAEDVEKINPDLVGRDEHGKVNSVRYEQINAMLLNEFLKVHRKIQEQEAMITKLRKEMETVVAHAKEQDSRIQKVSAQVEINKGGRGVVKNDPRRVESNTTPQQ